MRRPIAANAPLNTRINVTPIIDVSLTLVIILLITAPMLSVADLDLDLPQAATRGAEDERRIMVTMSAAGELAVADVMVSPKFVAAEVRRQLDQPGFDDALVVVRADAHLTHATVRAILDDVKAAGAKRIAIATRQKTGNHS